MFLGLDLTQTSLLRLFWWFISQSCHRQLLFCYSSDVVVSSCRRQLVLAALILGGALVYAVTIWSNTQKRMIEAPQEAIQKGVDTIKKVIQPDS